MLKNLLSCAVDIISLLFLCTYAFFLILLTAGYFLNLSSAEECVRYWDQVCRLARLSSCSPLCNLLPYFLLRSLLVHVFKRFVTSRVASVNFVHALCPPPQSYALRIPVLVREVWIQRENMRLIQMGSLAFATVPRLDFELNVEPNVHAISDASHQVLCYAILKFPRIEIRKWLDFYISERTA